MIGTPIDYCAGSQMFPAEWDGEFTRCPACQRKLKLGTNGRIPNHNAAKPKAPK